jgi:hypothetical protein
MNKIVSTLITFLIVIFATPSVVCASEPVAKAPKELFEEYPKVPEVMPPMPRDPRRLTYFEKYGHENPLDVILGKIPPKKGEIKKNAWGELGVRVSPGLSHQEISPDGFYTYEEVPTGVEVFLNKTLTDAVSVEVGTVPTGSTIEVKKDGSSLGKVKIRDYMFCLKWYPNDSMVWIPYFKLGLRWTQTTGHFNFEGRSVELQTECWNSGIIPMMGIGIEVPLTSRLLLNLELASKGQEYATTALGYTRQSLVEQGAHLGGGLIVQF